MYAEIRRPDTDFCCELIIRLIAVSWLVSPLSRAMELKGIIIAVPPYATPVAAFVGAYAAIQSRLCPRAILECSLKSAALRLCSWMKTAVIASFLCAPSMDLRRVYSFPGARTPLMFLEMYRAGPGCGIQFLLQ